MAVAELFGPTFQCEGPSCGQVSAFLRLSRCNLDCSWCDTPYTWDSSRFDLREETTWLDVAAVADRLLAIPAPIVVVSGGEPLIHHATLLELLPVLRAAGRRIEVATNGTLAPSPELIALVDHFEVSPKLANSDVPERRRIVPEALDVFARSGAAVFKFVAEGPADLEEVDALVPLLGGAPVWISPQGVTEEAVTGVMRRLAEPVLERGWNLSGRMHITLWGDERGR
jgi:7-carboxy-7-deazaguanine synthase